jgi:hypothetical protein
MLHQEINLMKVNKGAYISGLKVFNHLPQTIKMLVTDERRFKSAPRSFYIITPFYSLTEY